MNGLFMDWLSRRQGRSQAWAWGYLSPQNKSVAPPNEMKPNSLFGHGLTFFCFFSILFEQLKEPATCRIFLSLRKLLAQTLAKISPPKPKSCVHPCLKMVRKIACV